MFYKLLFLLHDGVFLPICCAFSVEFWIWAILEFRDAIGNALAEQMAIYLGLRLIETRVPIVFKTVMETSYKKFTNKPQSWQRAVFFFIQSFVYLFHMISWFCLVIVLWHRFQIIFLSTGSIHVLFFLISVTL